MALLSQRAYAKRRGISQAAVWKRTAAAGGPIPVHGPKKKIELDPGAVTVVLEGLVRDHLADVSASRARRGVLRHAAPRVDHTMAAADDPRLGLVR